jgi:polyisoprenoid-binding protein YceI
MKLRGFSLAKGTLAFVLALTCATSFAGQSELVRFDPATTKVNFTLGDILHTVHGTFHLKSGEIRFDTVTGAATGSLIVDPASGNSGNKTRDGKMKREILQTDRYPEIVFSPTHVSGSLPAQGNATLNIQGIFRIHGSNHDMTLSVPVDVKGNTVGVQTEFLVPYVAWGMKNPSTLFLRVDDKVKINVAANAQLLAEPDSKTASRK